MANEITLTASISAFKPSVMSQAVGMNIANILYSMSGTKWIEGVVSLDKTTPTVIPLGGVATLGWSAWFNTDTVNYCTIRNGASGAELIQLPPQGFAIFPLLPAAVPYGLGHTQNVICQYLILEQ